MGNILKRSVYLSVGGGAYDYEVLKVGAVMCMYDSPPRIPPVSVLRIIVDIYHYHYEQNSKQYVHMHYFLVEEKPGRHSVWGSLGNVHNLGYHCYTFS